MNEGTDSPESHSLEEAREIHAKEKTAEFTDLTEKDKTRLFQSAKSLIDQFSQNNPGKLPDIILLPDTSARPLFYLFKPAIEKLAEKRGISVPKFIFFQTVQDTTVQQMNLSKTSSLINKELDSLTFRNYMPGEDQRRDKEEIANLLRMKNDTQKKAEEIQNPEGRMKTRANEIIEYYQQLEIEHPDIVIFDDYASKDINTANAIRNAFGVNHIIPEYALLGQMEPEYYKDKDVTIGMKDPDSTESVKASGFDYKDKTSIKAMIKRVASIGVTADPANKYTKPQTQDNVSIHNLRQSMNKIGESVAETIV